MSVSGCSMWLPMWVFDGNGFTMACLAVWIRNVALRWGSSAMMMRSEAVMRRHPTAPVNIVRISVATFGTDFTAPEADFAAFVRAAALPSGEITFVMWELQEFGQRLAVADAKTSSIENEGARAFHEQT